MSRARAEIDLSAIAENLKFIKNKSDAEILAVVKADAYGHGLVEVGLAAERAGADWLGVALLEEAIKLRIFAAENDRRPGLNIILAKAMRRKGGRETMQICGHKNPFNVNSPPALRGQSPNVT